MHHQRLLNEYIEILARAALGIIHPCLREEQWPHAYREFAARFRKILREYETARERLLERLGPTEPER
jgi:hypothetical protein